YADRAEYLDHVHQYGIDVHAWGAGWQARKRIDLPTLKAAVSFFEDERLDGVKRLLRPRNGSVAGLAAGDGIDTSAYGHPRLRHGDLVKTFSSARISLGFATAGDSHRQGSSRL